MLFLPFFNASFFYYDFSLLWCWRWSFHQPLCIIWFISYQYIYRHGKHDTRWYANSFVFLVLRSWIIDDHFVCHIFRTVTRPYGQKISKTPPLPPRLTPTATPKVTSTAGSPKRSSVALLPKYASGASSPTKNHFEGLTLSPWYPSSKQSSAANSPPRGRSIPGLFFCFFWLI